MKKQYRLKKDLPDYKAGETLTKNGNTYYRFDNPLPNGIHSECPPCYVENTPDWFEPVEPKHKLLELLEREYDIHVPPANKYGYSLAVSTVRNYLQSESMVSEGKNERGFMDSLSGNGYEVEVKNGAAIGMQLRRYGNLIGQARSIQPNAGDSYYVELGKLLDKHLREERG